MAAHTTVGVHDDFSPRQSAVTVRSAQFKLASGIDVAFDFVAPHTVLLQDWLDDFGPHQPTQFGLGFTTPFRAMLGAENHIFDMQRATVFVGHSHLALGIWPKMGDGSGSPNLGLPSNQGVGKINGKRHELFGFAAGISKHQTLVTGTTRIDAASDVSTLRVQSDLHFAGAAIEAFVGGVVANSDGGFSGDCLVVWGFHAFGQADLPSKNKDVGAAKGFASHAGVGVPLETCVQDRIGNGIGQLVGVSFGNRFRGKGPAAGGHANSVGLRREQSVHPDAIVNEL